MADARGVAAKAGDLNAARRQIAELEYGDRDSAFNALRSPARLRITRPVTANTGTHCWRTDAHGRGAPDASLVDAP